MTLVAAQRRYYLWTGPELEAASNYELTALQVAVMTGRTLYAVRTKRQRMLEAARSDDGGEAYGDG